MGRNQASTSAPTAARPKVRRGLWSPDEDEKLYNYITRNGVGCWSSVPKLAGLQRCGKSCRLRWINYLRPDLKRGLFSQKEEELIVRLHELLGNRWAQIATQMPGRTDNEIKNFWNSCLKKKLISQGIDPITHKPVASEKEASNGENSIRKKMGQEASGNVKNSEEVSTANKAKFVPSDMEGKLLAGASSLFGATQFQGFGGSGAVGCYGSTVMINPFPHAMRPDFDSGSQFSACAATLPNFSDMSNFEQGRVRETDFSDLSGSRMSSSNSSNISHNYSGVLMNSCLRPAAAAEPTASCSWAQGGKRFETLFQFQDFIKSEEQDPWTQNSDDFNSYPALSLSEDLSGVDFEVFQEIINTSLTTTPNETLSQ